MEDEIMKKLKLKIAISEIKKENEIAMNRKRKLVSRKIGIAACACLILTTGIVFAKDIENYVKNIFNNSTDAIDMAVENGYLQTEDMDYVYDKDIGIKVNNLVLDDLNLDVSFNFETEKEDIKSIRFNDFIITNDNEKVIFRSEIKYAETLDELPLYNSVTWLNEPVKLTDTTFTDSIIFGLRPEREDFKEIYFDIKSLNIIYTDDSQEIIEGNWKFDVTINEEMRKCTSTEFVLAESNEYVESVNGILNPTGMVITLKLKEPLDIGKYIEDNMETIDETGLLFALKYNNKEYPFSYIEGGLTENILHYDSIGTFLGDIDELQLYIQPLDITINLNKQ